MNRRQTINKVLHEHIDVNKHEDYTNYKELITAIEKWHESEVKKLFIYDVSNFVCRKCSALTDVKLPTPEYCNSECGRN